jgi:hypothetical protein
VKQFGIVLVVVGLLWGVVAYNMPTTVTAKTDSMRIGSTYIPSSSAEVHNIGLMESRRNHLMLAGLTTLAGVILFGFGSVSVRDAPANRAFLRPCPSCAEAIQPAAVRCRFCGAEVEKADTVQEAPEATTQDETIVNSLIERAIANDIEGALALIASGADPYKEGTAAYESYSALDHARLGGHTHLQNAMIEAASGRRA